ncbi:hypothetical protein C8R43DRAFT_1124611 [Mycena crocata]|nr:hypothetical protein C8R43DRAFT_1124611 [Mycena crocata]
MPPLLLGQLITEVGLLLAFNVPRRRALLIGIRTGFHATVRSDTCNTTDSRASTITLTGPHNDVNSLKTMLIVKFGYNSSDVVVLMDHCNVNPMFYLTHENLASIVMSTTVMFS